MINAHTLRLSVALATVLAAPGLASAQMIAPANQSACQGSACPSAYPFAPQLQGSNSYRLAPQGQMRPQMQPRMNSQTQIHPQHIQPNMMQRPAPVMQRRLVRMPVPGPQLRPMRPVVMHPSQMRPQSVAPAGGRYGPAAPRNPSHAPDAKTARKTGFVDRLLGRGTDKHLYANYSDRVHGKRLPAYQMQPRQPHPLDQFQRWVDVEPQYALYPGDQVDIVVGSAPELSRTLTVGPDGRVVMPMTQPVMAAGKSLKSLETELTAQLSKQLRDPRIDVTPRAYGPQQIFVGGQVGSQGTYTLPGPIGAMEAILMAGGFATSAQMQQVVILRRTDRGSFMARQLNFKDGLNNPLSFGDNIQLRRGDIIFVPRSDISEIGLFMQQYVRDALPVNLALSYNLGETNQ